VNRPTITALAQAKSPTTKSFSQNGNEILVRANDAEETSPPVPDRLRTAQNSQQSSLIVSREGASATHYVAFWSEGNVLILCGHQHKTLPEAVACIQSADGFVKAFTDGRERPLTEEERQQLVRVLLDLYLDAKELSRKDSKTGALNDRAFREVLGYEIKRSRRNLTPMTVVSLDLDGFKLLNDTLGHPIGDLVLKVVVWTMQSTLREVDSIARPGGDEFALLLPETSAEKAHVVLDKLREALKDAMKTYKWEITFSIGVVTFKTPLATPDYMIEVADKRMYAVKKTGKNRVSYLVLD